MKISRYLVLAGVVAASSAFAAPQKVAWLQISQANPAVYASPIVPRLRNFAAYNLNFNELKGELAHAPVDRTGTYSGFPVMISLPRPDGTVERFFAVEQPIYTPELQAQHPETKTYYVKGIDDPTRTGRIGFTSIGFHGIVLGGDGAYYLDSVAANRQNTVTSYFKSDLAPKGEPWVCSTVGGDDLGEMDGYGNNGLGFTATGTNLKTYRLAMNATIEYTAARGGTVAAAQAAIVTSINRVNAIYERDMAMRMTLVLNNPSIGSDTFSNTNGSAMLSQNQTACDANPGNANYDIGHVFSTGGGGVAYLNGIRTSSLKAGGVTGSPSPVGDAFDIDYVAHEMGHQYGGNHSFNGTAGSCGGGNRNASTAWEPGSGSTIMAYAGICGTDDLQTNSDAMMHTGNYDEIISTRNLAIGTQTSVSNTPPVITPPTNVTIPYNTPFILDCTATDAEDAGLTYAWEQMNAGSPNWRSVLPTAVSYRIFPRLSTVLGGAAVVGETKATAAKTMTMRVTVRDNHAGGGGSDYKAMSVAATQAPMSVTSQTTNTTYNSGSSVPVTWNKGGTTDANVRMYMSYNSGTDFFTATPVDLGLFPNSGSANITFPYIGNRTSTVRLLIKGEGNAWFNVNSINFSSNESNSVTHTAAPASVISGTGATGTLSLASVAPTGGLTFTLSDNNANVTVPASVTVPAGQTSVDYPITTSVVGADATVTVTAARMNYTKLAQFTLKANTAPTANNDSYSVSYNTPLTVNSPGVLGNDSDPQGSAITAQIVSNPTKGTVVLNSNGSFTYTPNSGQSGVDTFTYKASDGVLTSSNATVTLTIDAPAAKLLGTVNLEGLAVDPSGIDVVVTLDNGSTTNTYTATLDSSGQYSIDLPTSLTGTFDVYIKANHWLRKLVGSRTLTGSGNTTADASLLNGDVDGDNTVTIFDYQILSNLFDQSISATNAVPDADLDEDGAVTIFDYVMLSMNFDLFGD
ncbi:MAG: cadherin-like domain-containing protein [Armatimonadetes bacterium]|nr:cadherin-like domain-containing protein [Armatimonadota bacterium]